MLQSLRAAAGIRPSILATCNPIIQGQRTFAHFVSAIFSPPQQHGVLGEFPGGAKRITNCRKIKAKDTQRVSRFVPYHILDKLFSSFLFCNIFLTYWCNLLFHMVIYSNVHSINCIPYFDFFSLHPKRLFGRRPVADADANLTRAQIGAVLSFAPLKSVGLTMEFRGGIILAIL